MLKRRYTVLIADRTTGVVRRVTISLRAALGVAGTVLMMPVLIGIGAKMSASIEIDTLRASGIAVDVTEQRHLALRSEAADMRLRTAIENTSESFVLWDAANKLVMARRIDPCMSEVYAWNDIPLAHMKMWKNEHRPGNMAVLVSAPRTGLKNFDDTVEAAGG